MPTRITITLDCETEQEAKTYLNGASYSSVLCSFDQYLRSIVKYASIENLGREANDDERHLADHLREQLRVFLSEHNIDLEP